jgi:uncharacterized protein YdhG (YjbR/CyaY superfamily)
MTTTIPKPKNFDEYLIAFPADTQKILKQVRNAIKKVAPDAEEVISYGMPAFKQTRILIYFAAFKNHIGFYPMSSGIDAFKTELSDYKWAKGSIQFPLNKPMPLKLITEIVKFRVIENSEKTKSKSKKR